MLNIRFEVYNSGYIHLFNATGDRITKDVSKNEDFFCFGRFKDLLKLTDEIDRSYAEASKYCWMYADALTQIDELKSELESRNIKRKNNNENSKNI